jgi:phosphate transport system substrate-binding protein
MKNIYIKIFILMLVILTLNTTGCTQKSTSNPGTDDLEGTITVSGAWAIYPMMIRWGEEYQKLHPGVDFDISAGGAGKGMADALAGIVDIGMVSREIYPEEADQGAFWVAVTKDAVFMTASENNPVLDELNQSGVTGEMLYAIYITGEITTWGEVVNNPEITEPIHLFTRSDACGAAATWAEYLDKKQEDLLGIGVYGDPGVLGAVMKDASGLGYNNLNFVYDHQTGLPVTGVQVVPIDLNGNGQIDAEERYDTKAQAINAIATGKYPSPPARDLNLVAQGKPTGLVKEFLAWILTDGQQYLDDVGYVKLPQDRIEQELSKLDQ